MRMRSPPPWPWRRNWGSLFIKAPLKTLLAALKADLEKIRLANKVNQVDNVPLFRPSLRSGVEHLPVVKGQAMPAYDPRAVQGIGVTYATSTQGADHTAGYALATNIMNVGGSVDPLKPGGQVELS